MDGFDRIYDLHRLLKGRKQALPLNDILTALECSRATFNRVKRHMTDFLGAPIVYNREKGGYFYDEGREQGYELPGLWLKESELHALLLIQSLLKNLGAGVLNEDLYPIEQRLNALLKKNAIDPGRLHDRIRLLGVGVRKVDSHRFLAVCNAVLKRQCLSIDYVALGDGRRTRRVISAQRIIQYRHNWYVDCWCHLRQTYRTFALDGVRACEPSDEPYVEVDAAALNAHFEGSYGLISAEYLQQAVLRFKAPLAQRIANEQWHPQQRGHWLDAHTFELQLPYNSRQPHELVMDILRYGHLVVVTEPASLRNAVQQALEASLARYQENKQ